jgi:hypothetical protein
MRTISLDTLNVIEISLSRAGVADVTAAITYSVTDSKGRFGDAAQSLIVTPTAAQQTALNAFWDKMIAAAKTQEGLP